MLEARRRSRPSSKADPSALGDFGSDILRGDFGSFDKMEARVRAVARDMEGVTIWSPDRGESSVVADAGATIRAAYPTVPIATRTYQPPTHALGTGQIDAEIDSRRS